MAPDFEVYRHDETVHDHEHVHISHHCRGGSTGEAEHLVATHMHDHNHSPLEHAHTPHDNAEREHSHEAHIHDHAHPTRS